MTLLRTALLSLFLAAPVQAAEVTVFAASSLKTALDQIAADWQAETGNRAVIAYGGSSALAKQIIEGAPADVFVSAAGNWMDAVQDAGLIRGETRRDFLGNRLVLIAVGTGVEPVAIDGGLDLVGLLNGGKLSMAMVDAVPAGQYGKAALTALGLWDGVKASVVQSENVRAALKLVSLGEAPLGIVYASDALAEPGVSVIGTFPEGSHRPIVYPGAVTTVSTVPEAAGFMDYLSSPAAGAVFVANGFLLLPTP